MLKKFFRYCLHIYTIQKLFSIRVDTFSVLIETFLRLENVDISNFDESSLQAECAAQQASHQDMQRGGQTGEGEEGEYLPTLSQYFYRKLSVFLKS